MGQVVGNQYDSTVFNVEADAPQVVYRHYGTDFAGNNCNDQIGGHLHLLYGFGENGQLVGFMGAEASNSWDGNYLSIYDFYNPARAN